jgi:hypothetical protein
VALWLILNNGAIGLIAWLCSRNTEYAWIPGTYVPALSLILLVLRRSTPSLWAKSSTLLTSLLMLGALGTGLTVALALGFSSTSRSTAIAISVPAGVVFNWVLLYIVRHGRNREPGVQPPSAGGQGDPRDYRGRENDIGSQDKG